MGWLSDFIERPVDSLLGSEGLVGNVWEASPQPARDLFTPGARLFDQLRGGGSEPTPEVKENQHVKDLRDSLSKESSDFRENIGQYKKAKETALRPTYDMALGEGSRKTREGFGRRGLLYSGLEQKAQGELRGELASQLAQYKTDISGEAESLASKKEEQAAAVGLENYSQLVSQAEQFYNLSAQNDLYRRQALGRLAQGIGYGAGAYYGAKTSDNSDTQQGLLTNQYNGFGSGDNHGE